MKHPPPPSRTGGTSRRSFLKTMGLGATSTAAAGLTQGGGLLADTPAALRSDAPDLGPGAVPVTLKVNGETVKMRLEPRVTLLDALRDHLRIDTHSYVDLTGAKRVCDRGTCGACTVLLDGKPVYACSVLAVEAQGQLVQTVEGLGHGDHLHPLQEEVVHCDGSQCGFCTPGFVMSGVALLRDDSSPSRDEIRRGLSGNICRCGTQAQFLEAVERAAARPREGR